MKRRQRSGLAGGLLLMAVTAAPAADLYVNTAATGPETGTQQAPFRTIQAAVDAAADGDVVRVAAGTYNEDVRIDGKAITLEGGYSTAWQRDLAGNTTTLTGTGDEAVITLIAADATIDGFRITGGRGSTEELPYSRHGGGIYSRDGSPTISNNVIESNDIQSADPNANVNFGGGIYVSNAPMATIVNNVVRGNFADRGAGMAVFGQAALIQGNTVEDNVSVGDHGGGLYIAVVDALITENIIRRNEVGRVLTYGWGGGLIVFNAGNSAELSFNVVYDNYASGYGAGEFIDEGATAVIHHELIYGNVSKDGCEAVSAIAVDGGADGGSQATISHCTVVGNICETVTRGNGLQVEGQSVVTVANSIFWNNGGDDFAVDGTSTLAVSYTDSQEPIAGTGNISADPLFVDETANDYRLSAGSPCIDAADPASPFNEEPAPNGGRADMGRYGNSADAPISENPGSGGTNGNSNGGDNDNQNDNGEGGNENDNGGAVNGNMNGGATGGNENDNAGGSDNANANSNGNNSNANGGSDPIDANGTAGGLCPAASMMLLSLSIVGLLGPRKLSRRGSR